MLQFVCTKKKKEQEIQSFVLIYIDLPIEGFFSFFSICCDLSNETIQSHALFFNIIYLLNFVFLAYVVFLLLLLNVFHLAYMV